MYITPTPDQNVELIPNLKDTQINTSKIKSQSDIKFNSLKSKHSSSPSNITTTASLLNQEKIKEFNLIEK